MGCCTSSPRKSAQDVPLGTLAPDTSKPPPSSSSEPGEHTANSASADRYKESSEAAGSVITKKDNGPLKQDTAHALGVHFSVIQELANDFPEATTEEICTQFVKPQTAGDQCAYIDLLSSRTLPNGLPAIATAGCFVSHAWKCKFADAVDCMAQHEEKHPNTYFWFDLLTNNQHKAVKYEFEWWCTTFKESIRDIGSVLLVMTPWNDPIPLRRAWCLFEIFSTIDVKAAMNIVIPSSQKEPFKTAIIEKSAGWVLTILLHLNAISADATNPADRDQIFEVVRTQISGGFVGLNTTVKGHLRSWFVEACASIAAASEDPDLLYHCAGVCFDLGHADAALRITEKALQLATAAAGEQAPGHRLMAKLYDAMGIYSSDDSKSKEYFEKALTYPVTSIPHLLLASNTSTNLSALLRARGELDQAIELCEEAREIQESFFAIEDPVLGRFCNDPTLSPLYLELGMALEAKGDYAGALEQYEKTLEIASGSMLGKAHPEVARAHRSIAVVSAKTGDREKAKEHIRSAASVSLVTLGEEHPLSASIRQCADLINSEGDMDKSLQFFERRLNTQVTSGPEFDPYVVDLCVRAGFAFREKKNFDRALSLFEKALASATAMAGKVTTPPDLAHLYHHIGTTYHLKGDLSRALESLEKALALKLEAVGDAHIDVAPMFGAIGSVYESMGDDNAALLNTKRAFDIREAAWGDKDAKLAAYASALGKAYERVGDIGNALAYFQKDLFIQLANMKTGAPGPEATHTFSSLGRCYVSLNDFEHGMEMFTRCLMLLKMYREEGDPFIAQTHFNLAICYEQLGDLGQAAQNYVAALQIFAAAFGAEHKSTQAVLASIQRIQASLP